jgi:hypothetical protein
MLDVRRRARKLSLLAVAAFLTVGTGAVAPAAHAETVVDPGSAGTFYLHGGPDDDAQRLNRTPTATFDRAAPTAASLGRTQTGTIRATSTTPANTLSVYWMSNAFIGEFTGTVHLDWWWSSPNPVAQTNGTSITVSVFADVDFATGAGTLIGQGQTTLRVGSEPTNNVADIPGVTGKVTRNLVVQAVVDSDDTGPANTVHYDSVSTPSSFTLIRTTSSWTIEPSQNHGSVARDEDAFNSVTCLTAEDCWAVGHYYSFDAKTMKTLVHRNTGSGWTIFPSPNTALALNKLRGVTCVATDDCWAVGHSSVDGAINQTLIMHFDGADWSLVSTPNTRAQDSNSLNSVACRGADDCWAVGEYHDGMWSHALTLHFDGTSWAIVASPDAGSGASNYVAGVTCRTDACWAVGGYVPPGTRILQTAIRRNTGAGWTIVPSPNTGPDHGNYLGSVACPAVDSCWAVGTDQDGSVTRTMIQHWDGTSWTIVESPNTKYNLNALDSVSCSAADNCWAVGAYYTGITWQTFTTQYAGNGWIIGNSPNHSYLTLNLLHGVACPEESTCWAVGEWLEGPIRRTLVARATLFAPSPVVPELPGGPVTGVLAGGVVLGLWWWRRVPRARRTAQA